MIYRLQASLEHEKKEKEQGTKKWDQEKKRKRTSNKGEE